MSLPVIPPYNLSFSTMRTADQCERRAALMGPGAWQAWRGGARAEDPIASLCYRGKNLHDLLPSLGQSIHTVAERVVKSVARTGRCAEVDTLYADVITPMRQLWTRSRLAFEQNPKLGYLRSRYMGETEPASVTEQVKVRARIAVQRLRNAPLFDDLRALDRTDRLRTEELLSMPVACDGMPPATLFGKADVAYTERHALQTDMGILAPGEHGIPVIVDFKTGRVRPQEAILQLSLLALLLRAQGIEPHPVAGYVGRVVDLSEHGTDDDRYVLLGAQELSTAEEWVREGVARLARMPRDTDGFVRLTDVPRTVGESCRRCPMRTACAAVQPFEDAPPGGIRHAA